MAIDVNLTYPGKVNIPDANYDHGSIKNETVPDSSDDGTPLDEKWGNDFEGFKQAVMKAAGIAPASPGNVPETMLLSQVTQAIVELSSGRAFNYDDSGAADVYVFDVQTNQQAPQSLFDGLEVQAVIANTNTGASTINVAGLGVINIKLQGGVTNPAAGDLTNGNLKKLTYRTSPSAHFEMDQTGSTNLVVITASGSYAKPDGLKKVKVTNIGGGGSSGGSGDTDATQASSGGGGGGGGASIEMIMASALSASETVTIGAGATGNSASAGSAGGTTSFGAHCSATGGLGGGYLAPSNASEVRSGGKGGGGIGGDINIDGQGGGATGNFLVTTVRAMGGTGGSSFLGGGAEGINQSIGGSTVGTIGGDYGGGGGGSVSVGVAGADTLGADGGDGVIIVEEFF